MNLLNTELEEIKKGKKKKIRLATECYTCYHWLPSVVREFKKNNTDINIQIDIESTKDPLRYLIEGKIDIAIVSNTIHNSPIYFEPLITDEMVVILSKDNDLANFKTLDLSNLKNQNLILYDIPEEKNYVLTKILKNDKKIINSIQKVQLTEAIIELVSANLGISVMARWAVIPFLENKRLKIIPFKSNKGQRNWFIASLDKVSEVERFFMEQIKKNFDQ